MRINQTLARIDYDVFRANCSHQRTVDLSEIPTVSLTASEAIDCTTLLNIFVQLNLFLI